jgi:hypothetical protein
MCHSSHGAGGQTARRQHKSVRGALGHFKVFFINFVCRIQNFKFPNMATVVASTVAPLLKNRTVRSFLDGFHERDWELATKYALIYGIQCLSFNAKMDGPLTVEKIQALIRTFDTKTLTA